jgi:hypothetical protein
VIPGNLVGLILFLAAVAPGYVFVRTSERFRARPGRSALLEAAELLVIGAACTTIASLIAVGLAEWLGGGFLDIPAWAEQGNDYLRGEPYRLAWSVGFVLLVASAAAFGLAHLANRGRTGDIVLGVTVWSGAFEAAGHKGQRAWLTAHLHDGRIVEGYVKGYPTGASDVQALALQRPITVTETNGSRALVPGTNLVIIDAGQIAMIGVRYEPDGGVPGSGRGGGASGHTSTRTVLLRRLGVSGVGDGS